MTNDKFPNDKNKPNDKYSKSKCQNKEKMFSFFVI